MGNDEYIIYSIVYSDILYLCKYIICIQYTYLSITYSLYLDMCGLVLMGFIFVGGVEPYHSWRVYKIAPKAGNPFQPNNYGM